MGFPGGSVVKESTCQYRGHRRCQFDPWAGKIPGGGNANPLWYSCLENPMDRGVWQAIVLCIKYSDVSPGIINVDHYTKMLAYFHCLKVKSLSCVRLFVTPWTVAYNAFPSMGFSRQEYWNGFPFPSPEDLPNPGIEPGSPAL